MATSQKVTDAKSVREQFPTKPARIEGELTLKESLQILNYMTKCGQTHCTIGELLGKLYLVVNAVYRARRVNLDDTAFCAPPID